MENIVDKILVVREQRVLLDADLAALYGVNTKRLNEQVKRNKERFPEDFMFQLRAEEKTKVVANCDHLRNLRFSPALPYAFTEHGAIMAATVLNSPQAVQMSVFVVRAFIRLRQMVLDYQVLYRKVTSMERKYDAQFQGVFSAIKQLMTPPETKRKRIGFTISRKEG
jgi:hypothetical protein